MLSKSRNLHTALYLFNCWILLCRLIAQRMSETELFQPFHNIKKRVKWWMVPALFIAFFASGPLWLPDDPDEIDVFLQNFQRGVDFIVLQTGFFILIFMVICTVFWWGLLSIAAVFSAAPIIIESDELERIARKRYWISGPAAAEIAERNRHIPAIFDAWAELSRKLGYSVKKNR